MNYPYLSGVNYESVVDGPGVRAAIFLSGCNHNCPGCHNQETHDPTYGSQLNDAMIYTIAYLIDRRPYLSGITLTGGDPLYNVEATLNFLKKLKEDLAERWDSLTVWLYTGYTWEQLMCRRAIDEHLQELLSMVHVVVDGPFLQSKADARLPFCGSSNQRLIDVQKSLQLSVPLLFNPFL
jgi:anaerobic ribonucleoside-triphosphate reductase activating protein